MGCAIENTGWAVQLAVQHGQCNCQCNLQCSQHESHHFELLEGEQSEHNMSALSHALISS